MANRRRANLATVKAAFSMINRSRRLLETYLGGTSPAAQQQLADQMRLYWKVNVVLQLMAVSWADGQEGMPTNLIRSHWTVSKPCCGSRSDTIEQLTGFMEAARREGLVVVREWEWDVEAESMPHFPYATCADPFHTKLAQIPSIPAHGD
ncbi:hypothetical protein GGX14DRAFT_618412 [Mycena pura]|uniref:Uncharacterized protein n=1 Tax=Mycena pura TaxID=153505 RepID=A0AAD6VRE1_9AGAR|nr:hypothetical protein GGX14DRAFT_618412 [Mycena pura]